MHKIRPGTTFLSSYIYFDLTKSILSIMLSPLPTSPDHTRLVSDVQNSHSVIWLHDTASLHVAVLAAAYTAVVEFVAQIQSAHGGVHLVSRGILQGIHGIDVNADIAQRNVSVPSPANKWLANHGTSSCLRCASRWPWTLERCTDG